MLRPIDTPALFDQQTRPTVRPQVEKSAEATPEQANITVVQAAVVALGTTNPTANDAQPALSTYRRAATPFPGGPVAQISAVRAAATETASAVQATPLADAVSAGRPAATPEDASGETSSQKKAVRSNDGVVYAVSGQVVVNPGSIVADPQMAIRELTQLQNAALAPPTTLDDMQVAARAAIELQRAQQELARKRYLEEAGPEVGHDAASTSTTTDIRA